MWTAGSGEPIPVELTGIRWPNGSTECRFRLLQTDGSLVASDGEVGEVLTDPTVECTTCSAACTG